MSTDFPITNPAIQTIPLDDPTSVLKAGADFCMVKVDFVEGHRKISVSPNRLQYSSLELYEPPALDEIETAWNDWRVTKEGRYFDGVFQHQAGQRTYYYFWDNPSNNPCNEGQHYTPFPSPINPETAEWIARASGVPLQDVCWTHPSYQQGLYLYDIGFAVNQIHIHIERMKKFHKNNPGPVTAGQFDHWNWFGLGEDDLLDDMEKLGPQHEFTATGLTFFGVHLAGMATSGLVYLVYRLVRKAPVVNTAAVAGVAVYLGTQQRNAEAGEFKKTPLQNFEEPPSFAGEFWMNAKHSLFFLTTEVVGGFLGDSEAL